MPAPLSAPRVRWALPLLAGAALGAGTLYWYQGQADPFSTAAMVEGLQQRNELVVFAAQVVPVVTSRTDGIVDLLDSEQTAIIPATVNYTLDMRKVTARNIQWDAEQRTMTITLPPLTVAPPNLMEQSARYYRKGVWITGADAEGLYRRNSTAAANEADKLARNATLMTLARTAAETAVRENAAAFLSGAGFRDARVVVRFDGD